MTRIKSSLITLVSDERSQLVCSVIKKKSICFHPHMFCFVLFSHDFYLKRFNPDTPPHWGLFMIIRITGTQKPQIHQWVYSTIVMATLMMTSPNVCQYGCFQFYVRCLAIHFIFASSSVPRRPSAEQTNNHLSMEYGQQQYPSIVYT